MEYLAGSADDTFELGRAFAQNLRANSIVCLFGDLGTGKTTFIKGIASTLLGTFGDEVQSPTFNYLNIYYPKPPCLLALYHFDLYRLQGSEDFLSMGFDEFFELGGVCCLEWAERIAALEIQEAWKLHFADAGKDGRRITMISPKQS